MSGWAIWKQHREGWPWAAEHQIAEPAEDADYSPEEYGEALAWLQLKGLARLDYDLPLRNFDYAAYGDYPLHGSAALTAAGQEAVEALEVQGAEA